MSAAHPKGTAFVALVVLCTVFGTVTAENLGWISFSCANSASQAGSRDGEVAAAGVDCP